MLESARCPLGSCSPVAIHSLTRVRGDPTASGTLTLLALPAPPGRGLGAGRAVRSRQVPCLPPRRVLAPLLRGLVLWELTPCPRHQGGELGPSHGSNLPPSGFSRASWRGGEATQVAAMIPHDHQMNNLERPLQARRKGAPQINVCSKN